MAIFKAIAVIYGGFGIIAGVSALPYYPGCGFGLIVCAVALFYVVGKIIELQEEIEND